MISSQNVSIFHVEMGFWEHGSFSLSSADVTLPKAPLWVGDPTALPCSLGPKEGGWQGQVKGMGVTLTQTSVLSDWDMLSELAPGISQKRKGAFLILSFPLRLCNGLPSKEGAK